MALFYTVLENLAQDVRRVSTRKCTSWYIKSTPTRQECDLVWYFVACQLPIAQIPKDLLVPGGMAGEVLERVVAMV